MSEKDLFDNEEFKELGDLSEWDNLVLETAGEDDIVERMQQENETQAEKRAPWMRDVKDNWFMYALLGLSFLLTEMFAIYLGLAPKLVPDPNSPTGTSIHFNTDIGHLLTALVYMLVFPIVTEIAFDRAYKKFMGRETGNFTQQWTMTVAVALSIASIIGTGVAGGYLVLSTLGSVGYIEIPPSVQMWIIWVIPGMLAGFAVLHRIYDSGSKHAKLQKMIAERKRKADLADQLRDDAMDRAGRRAIKKAAYGAYRRAVAKGLISQEEANAGLAAGKSLQELEKDLGKEITGDGVIGPVTRRNLPLLGKLPQATSEDPGDVVRPAGKRRPVLDTCMECGGPSNGDMFCSDECESDYLERQVRHQSNRLSRLRNNHQTKDPH